LACKEQKKAKESCFYLHFEVVLSLKNLVSKYLVFFMNQQ
jgi:hypothetical protein